MIGLPLGTGLAAVRMQPYANTRDVRWPLLADAFPEGIAFALLGLALWWLLARGPARRPFLGWLVTALAFLPAAIVLVLPLNRICLPDKFEPLSLVANGCAALAFAVLTYLGAKFLARWREAPAGIPISLVVLGAVPVTAHLLGDVRTENSAPDVLVLLVDVLGAQRLGCYGYERPSSPNIDAFAEDAVLFENAISASTFTKTSVATLFTGLNPHHHLVYRGDLRDTHDRITSDVLGDEKQTLAELVSEQGLTPVAWVQNGQIHDYMGFAQGFAYYGDQMGSITKIRPLFKSWANSMAERTQYFAYLHFIDLHAPYVPPNHLRGRYGPDTPASRERVFDSWRVFRNEVNFRGRELSEADLEALSARHDETLLFVDEWVGGILDDLRASGRYDDTMIVLLGDHGDAFMQHGFIAHAMPPFDELVHVPLIVKLPGNAQAGRRESRMVGLVDLAPTLLDYLGAPVPDSMDGRSFLDLLLDPQADMKPRTYFSEIERTIAMRTQRWKYLRFPRKAGRLYDLAADPGETTEVSALHPEVAERFELAVQHAIDERKRGGHAETVVLDEETVDALKALGYL